MEDSSKASLEKLRRDLQELQQHFHALLRALSVREPALHAQVCREKFNAVRRQFPLGTTQSSASSPLFTLLKKPALFGSMSSPATLRDLAQASRSCKERMGQRLFVFGGMPATFTDEPSKLVECLDLSRGVWTPVLPAMRFARGGCVVAALQASIFVCGGQGNMGKLVDKYVPKLGRWDFKVPVMGQPRENAAAAVLRGRLYVCGGSDFSKDSVHRSVESFDPSLGDGRGEWRSEAQMLKPRRNLGAAALGTDRLLVCGGDSVPVSQMVKAQRPMNSAESLNGSQVFALPSMRVRRSCLAAASLKGAVFVCGGQSEWVSHQSVECFCPQIGSWTAVAPMLRGRALHAAVATVDSLYVLGGADRCVPPGSVHPGIASVEQYDPELDRWEYVDAMIEGKMSFACTSL